MEVIRAFSSRSWPLPPSQRTWWPQAVVMAGRRRAPWRARAEDPQAHSSLRPAPPCTGPESGTSSSRRWDSGIRTSIRLSPVSVSFVSGSPTAERRGLTVPLDRSVGTVPGDAVFNKLPKWWLFTKFKNCFYFLLLFCFVDKPWENTEWNRSGENKMLQNINTQFIYSLPPLF